MDLLIFDLDGTLVDTKQDLANSVNATRAFMGMGPLSGDRVESYVGSGAGVLIRRALGEQASEADVERALEYFLVHYDQHKLDCTRAYPGVPDGLSELARDGVRMAVLTNKPVRMSVRILEGLELAGYMDRIYGGNSFQQKKPDPVGVETLLAELGVDRSRALMVGDSGVDVRTGRNAGIRVCGVTWGFQPETFAGDPPDMLVDSMEQLARQVISERNRLP